MEVLEVASWTVCLTSATETLQPGEEFLLPFGSEGDFAYHDALYPEVEAGSVRVVARDYGVPSVGLSPIPEAPPLDGLNFSPIDGYGSLSGNGVGLFGFSSDYDPKTTRGFLSPGYADTLWLPLSLTHTHIRT